jgi:hypothetical protein
MKIRPVLEKHRKEAEMRDAERQIYNYIKKLILFAENEEPEAIHEIVHKISMIFPKNVDKNDGRKYQKYSLVVSVYLSV